MRPASLTVLILVFALPASATDVIRVTVSCPAANALTRLNRRCSLPSSNGSTMSRDWTRVESESRNDGSGTVTAYFLPKTDMNLAEVRVQNRVNLALSAIPDTCRQQGILVQKFPSGPPQFWLALTSTAPDHDEELLNKFAILNVKPELTRVPGVADVRLIASSEFDLQVWLNRIG